MILRDQHYRINTTSLKHRKLPPYQKPAISVVITKFKAILLHHSNLFFHDAGEGFGLVRVRLRSQPVGGACPPPRRTLPMTCPDAPFRKTQPAIDAMVKRNLMAVEMEAAALCAFAQVRQKLVLSFAHVSNQMGRVDGDFEKGEADGSHDALQLIATTAERLRSRCQR
jgi:hypothetical protein